jgi:putative tryptophan/tyrosine transport system substrate-binding protein
MQRRQFIMLLGGAAVAWPVVARAQQPARTRRIGVLMSSGDDDLYNQTRVAMLRQGLEKLGWIEGRNVQIDYRWAAGEPNLAKGHAAELVGLSPDVIVANSTMSLSAVAQETRTIPIVFLVVGDPVGQGFVTSLAHPGGNVTGFSAFEFAISGKWLELIKQVAPDILRVAFIYNPQAGPYAEKFVQTIAPVASAFGVKLIVSPTRDVAEIDRAIAGLAGKPKAGLIVNPDGFTTANRGPIISLAARYRLPAIYAYRYFTADGGLLSYGHDPDEPFRAAASYIDKIFRGAIAGDLPIQQPTKFEFVINLKTAKALGLDISPALLSIADELIE